MNSFFPQQPVTIPGVTSCHHHHHHHHHHSFVLGRSSPVSSSSSSRSTASTPRRAYALLHIAMCEAVYQSKILRLTSPSRGDEDDDDDDDDVVAHTRKGIKTHKLAMALLLTMVGLFVLSMNMYGQVQCGRGSFLQLQVPRNDMATPDPCTGITGPPPARAVMADETTASPPSSRNYSIHYALAGISPLSIYR